MTAHNHESADWLTACAWCDRIRTGDTWVETQAAADTRSARSLRFTHSICPDCFDRLEHVRRMQLRSAR